MGLAGSKDESGKVCSTAHGSSWHWRAKRRARLASSGAVAPQTTPPPWPRRAGQVVLAALPPGFLDYKGRDLRDKLDACLEKNMWFFTIGRLGKNQRIGCKRTRLPATACSRLRECRGEGAPLGRVVGRPDHQQHALAFSRPWHCAGPFSLFKAARGRRRWPAHYHTHLRQVQGTAT
jgi:hypothetical protein